MSSGPLRRPRRQDLVRRQVGALARRQDPRPDPCAALCRRRLRGRARLWRPGLQVARAHSERLHKSAEILGYKIPYSVDEIEQAKAEVVKADRRRRLLCARRSPGAAASRWASSAQQAKIHLAIAAWEWPSYFSPELLREGHPPEMGELSRGPAPDTAPTASKASGLYMICTISKHDGRARRLPGRA